MVSNSVSQLNTNLVGNLEVRYVSKIPAQKTSYSGRGFLWVFSVPSGIYQYSISNMPPPTNFLFHYPQCWHFKAKCSGHHFVTLLRFAVTGFGPWKQLWCHGFIEYVCLNSKNSRKSLIFVANNDGHTQCCYLIINSISSSLHPWSLKYGLKEMSFFCFFFRQLAISFASNSQLWWLLVYKPHYREVTHFLFCIRYTDYQKTICLTNLKKNRRKKSVCITF